MNKNKLKPAALGFRVHTGWAAMIAVTPPGESPLPTILDRRRVEMIFGTDPQERRFTYHAAAKLTLDAAQRFVLETEKIALSRAKDELATAICDLLEGGYEVVASGTIVSNNVSEHAQVRRAERFRRGDSKNAGERQFELRAGGKSSPRSLRHRRTTLPFQPGKRTRCTALSVHPVCDPPRRTSSPCSSECVLLHRGGEAPLGFALSESHFGWPTLPDPSSSR